MKKEYYILLILLSIVALISCADNIGDDDGPSVEQEDKDSDGVKNSEDNCEDDYNPEQEDIDEDGVGDECEATDRDGDTVPDQDDNCPDILNEDQLDSDSDDIGDACEDSGDQDGDGVANDSDNCIDTSNIDQNDKDGDQIGDECDDVDDSSDIPVPSSLKVSYDYPTFKWSSVDYENILDYIVEVKCVKNCSVYNELEYYNYLEPCEINGTEYVLYEYYTETEYSVHVSGEAMNCHGTFVPGSEYKWRVGTVSDENPRRVSFSNFEYFEVNGNLTYGLNFKITDSTISWNNVVTGSNYILGVQCITGCDKHKANDPYDCFADNTIISRKITNVSSKDDTIDLTIGTKDSYTSDTRDNKCIPFETLYDDEIYNATIIYCTTAGCSLDRDISTLREDTKNVKIRENLIFSY
jgi:hypothetical protein